jgi:DNA-binding NarL/FixJ family response regulator
MLDRAVAVARGIQCDIAVETEVQRRLTRCSVSESGPGAVDQRLRDVHAELALIRNGASGRTRQLIEDLMHRLSDAGPAAPVRALPTQPKCVRLSVRELDVITQAAAGHRNAEIGRLLGLTEGTVKAYLFSACRKLGVKNRIEAVIAARRLGLIP